MKSFKRNTYLKEKLNVVAQHWIRHPYIERVCLTCEVLHEEFHFVFRCISYDFPAKKKNLKPDYLNQPLMFKFIQLLTSENVKL